MPNVISRPERQKPSYISAINHNKFVALVGETESVVGEIIHTMCGGLVAVMFRNGIKLFIERNNWNKEKLGDDDRIGDLPYLPYLHT